MALTQPAPLKVFISYSHDTVEHQERVLGLADRLRADGIDAEIDQYNASPPEGWALWCERQIEAADFVLMVCTEIYQRRVKGDEASGMGLGVVWEARIIRQLLYDAGAVSDKFVPVLFSDASPEHIPTPIKGWARYVVDTKDGYEELYRHLTGQPRLLKRPVGKIRALPPRKIQWTEVTMVSNPVPPPPSPAPTLRRLVLAVSVVSVLVLVLVFLAMFHEDVRSQVVTGVRYIWTAIDPNGPPRVPRTEITYLAPLDAEPLRTINEKLIRTFQMDTPVTIKAIHPDPSNIIEQIKEQQYDVALIDIIFLNVVGDDLINISLLHSDDRTLHLLNNTAAYYWNDVGLLYYRKHLLNGHKVPNTWEELEREAVKIQKDNKDDSEFVAFAWEGAAYDGLTCNALEWLASNGGVREDGQINYDSDEFLTAIYNARKWVKGTFDAPAISSRATGYNEEKALNVFMQDKAVFLRSWPSAYKRLKNKFHGDLGVAPLPHSQHYPRNVGVLGGAALAVSQSSKKKVEALSFIKYLTNEEIQQWRIREGDYPQVGGSGIPELDNVVNAIYPISRTSDEKVDITKWQDVYTNKSLCFAHRIQEAIQSHSDEEFKKNIDAIKLCQLTKVEILEPAAMPLLRKSAALGG